MKNYLSILFLSAFVLPSSVFAQDIIYMLDGDEIEAKLTEISSSQLKYKRMDNLDGPLFVIERSKVFKVKYANGQSEVMTKPGSAPAAQPAAKASNSSPASNVFATPTTANGTDDGTFSVESFKANGQYFNNQPYIVDRGSGQIVKTEKGTPEIKTSTVAAPFYASSSSSWMMKGENSNVRLSGNGEFNFVIKVAPGLDPEGIIKLVRFDLLQRSRRDPSKDRHMPAMKTTGSWGGASSQQVTDNDVQIEIKWLADGVYEIIPRGGLSSGEYAFYILHKFYAFGID